MANGNQIPFAIPAIFSEHIRYWIVSGEQVFDGKRMSTGISAINAAVQEASSFVPGLLGEINRVVVGQKYLVERLVIGLLANGHVLLEGVPGLAKTLSVKTLANSLNVRFSRLQFTPDMLPADVIGTQIFNPHFGNIYTIDKNLIRWNFY